MRRQIPKNTDARAKRRHVRVRAKVNGTASTASAECVSVIRAYLRPGHRR